jgi:hypothetical protein
MDELAKLISSLSKSEKRYFKLFSSFQSGEKEYLKIFDAVEKSGDYDEDKIKKTFQGEEFLKRLPAVKHYLYNQILRALRHYNAGETVESQIKEMIADISNLFDKRLYTQCSKIIAKAKSLAVEHEKFLLQLEVNIWEEKVLNEILKLEPFEAHLAKSLEEEKEALLKQTNLSQYRNLYNRMVVLNRKIKEARAEEELQPFNEIIQHPLLTDISNALSFEACLLFYVTNIIYFHAKGDNEKVYYFAKEQLKLLEANPVQINERPKTYLSALNNILLGQIHLHRYENFEEDLKKVRALPLKSLNLEVSRFISSYTFEMVMYLDTGEFQKGVTIVDDIFAGLKKYSDKINAVEEVTILYNVFYLYFGTGQYSKALKIINRLLSDYQKELRYDIQSAVRILNLMLHYELGNESILESSALSTYRFLYKSKRLYKLENIVLNYIRKVMPGITTKAQQIEAFKVLRSQFQELIGDPYEAKAFEYFDYISWLDAKISGVSFEDVAKKKFKEQQLVRA